MIGLVSAIPALATIKYAEQPNVSDRKYKKYLEIKNWKRPDNIKKKNYKIKMWTKEDDHIIQTKSISESCLKLDRTERSIKMRLWRLKNKIK